MGITVNAPMPDKPISGASLMKGSVAGRKSQIVKTTEEGTTTSVLAAGSAGNILCPLALYPEDIPDQARTIDNIIPPEFVLATPQVDIYIDTDNDYNYFWTYGASLTSDARSMRVENIMQIGTGPFNPSSALAIYKIKNEGASSHTFYFHIVWKYIIFGDYSL